MESINLLILHKTVFFIQHLQGLSLTRPTLSESQSYCLMRMIRKLFEVLLISFRGVSTISYFHYVIHRRTNFQVSHLTLSISCWWGYFYFSRLSSLITWKIRRFVFKKKLFINCTLVTMAVVGQTEGTQNLFQILTFKRSWH